MKPEDRRLILEDGGRTSSRVLARRLGLTRSEVEAERAQARRRETQPSPDGPEPSGRFDWIAVAALLAVSLALRAFFIRALEGTPFFGPLSPKLDDGVYDQMAQSIAAGNWIGRFPDGAFRIPGYPYFLGVIYAVFGRSLTAVHWIQAALGSFVPVLTYFVSRRLFGCRKSALAAGALTAAYVPLIFFENMLLGEGLSVLLNTAGWAALALGWGRRERAWPFALAGALWGLSCLLRPNTLLGVAAAAVFFLVWHARRGEWKTACARAALVAGCAAAAIAPIAVRNAVLYQDRIPITALAGVNLYIGNNPEADGRFHLTPEIGSALGDMLENSRSIAERAAGRPLKPSEISGYWTRRALAYWAGDPLGAARLLLLKTGLFLNRYEYPDILGIDFAAQLVPPLGFRPVDHGLVVVLAAYGLWRLRGRYRREWPLAAYGVFTGAYAASIVLFFLTARYRMPASVLLIPPAGYGLVSLAGSLRRLDVGRMRGAALVALGAFTAAYWPVERTTQAGNFNSLGVYYRHAGEYAKAEACYRRALELEPSYASPHRNLAILLDKTGRHAEAAEEEKIYLEMTAAS